MISISAKVGPSGVNRPVDVMIVQHLLNLDAAPDGSAAPFDITGVLGPSEIKALQAFQTKVLGLTTPDGRVDSGGKTLQKLALPAQYNDTFAELRSVTSASARCAGGGTRAGEASSELGSVNTQLFSVLYDRQFHQLGGSAREGLGWLLNFINQDSNIVDVGHCAYMLATVKHECAETWKPIKEYGQGSGHSYGTAVVVTEPGGTKHTNAYYGRGYVQLTWQSNYQKLGQAIGLGDELLYNPELALDPEVSYGIMSYGMRTGAFTGKKLSDYINQSKCDYLNARRIINGVDRQVLIADYANNIEMLLRAVPAY